MVNRRQPRLEPEELPTEAMLAIRSGRKIEAIKIVREQTGLGLAEAKRVVDQAARAAEPQMPRLAHGKEDSGVLRLIAVMVILGAVVAAILLL
jgi:hypothetical protein